MELFKLVCTFLDDGVIRYQWTLTPLGRCVAFVVCALAITGVIAICAVIGEVIREKKEEKQRVMEAVQKVEQLETEVRG